MNVPAAPSTMGRPWRDRARSAGRRLLRSRLGRFAFVGAVTTVAYLGLYLVLLQWLHPQVANAISLLITADANSALNRRLTFGLRGGPHALRQRFKGVLAFGISLLLTSAALAVMQAGGVSDGRWQLVVLAAANLVSGGLHYLLLRYWAFSSPYAKDADPAGDPAEQEPACPAVR